MQMPKDVLETATLELLGGDPVGLDLDRLKQLITLTLYATDLLLNEIECRGELTFVDGVPCVPYMSDHRVKTILTRDDPAK